MKFIVTIALVFVIGVWEGAGLAADSTTVRNQPKKSPQQKQVQVNAKKSAGKIAPQNGAGRLKGFMDRNANGIDDRLEGIGRWGKHKAKGRRMDRFIDRDGDGICDGRESAMGLRKLYRGKHGRRKR